MIQPGNYAEKEDDPVSSVLCNLRFFYLAAMMAEMKHWREVDKSLCDLMSLLAYSFNPGIGVVCEWHIYDFFHQISKAFYVDSQLLCFSAQSRLNDPIQKRQLILLREFPPK